MLLAIFMQRVSSVQLVAPTHLLNFCLPGKNCIPIFTILEQLSFGATNWLYKWRNR
nr:MAG TPA: hypothetical protein [Caudoviricetes sp.]